MTKTVWYGDLETNKGFEVRVRFLLVVFGGWVLHNTPLLICQTNHKAHGSDKKGLLSKGFKELRNVWAQIN
jgi:hypothetical protein